MLLYPRVLSTACLFFMVFSTSILGNPEPEAKILEYIPGISTSAIRPVPAWGQKILIASCTRGACLKIIEENGQPGKDWFFDVDDGIWRNKFAAVFLQVEYAVDFPEGSSPCLGWYDGGDPVSILLEGTGIHLEKPVFSDTSLENSYGEHPRQSHSPFNRSATGSLSGNEKSSADLGDYKSSPQARKGGFPFRQIEIISFPQAAFNNRNGSWKNDGPKADFHLQNFNGSDFGILKLEMKIVPISARDIPRIPPFEELVRKTFRFVLRRDPSTREYERFLSALKGGRLQPNLLIINLCKTDEFFEKFLMGMRKSQAVKEIYERFVGRKISGVDLAFFCSWSDHPRFDPLFPHIVNRNLFKVFDRILSFP